MEKFNKWSRFILSAFCILKGIASYYDILSTPILSVTLGLSAIVSSITMLQTYNYQEYETHNSSLLWLIFSALNGTIIVATLYAIGCKAINEQVCKAILMGLSPAIFPVIGLFLGNCGRILIKSEPSTI